MPGGMKTTSLATIGFMAFTLAASAAQAQGSPEAGVEVGLRTGLMLPFGSVQGGGMGNNNLDNYASKALPFVLEGGYRFDSNWFAGLRFQYAIPDLKGNCANMASCDGSVITLGIEGTYRINPGQPFVPWVGAGLLYEWTSVDWTTNVVNANGGTTVSGILPMLQAGGDFHVGQQLVLGPFIEGAFGRFDSASTRTMLGNQSFEMNADIQDTAWHTWVTLGVRGAFDI